MPVGQLFVVVERGTARVRARLVPVEDHSERLAAVNRRVGIAPLEALGEGDRGALAEAYHVFRRLDLADASGSGEDPLASAFSAWGEALARSGIGLRLERRALYGVPLSDAYWRAGAAGASPRPWDVELTALAAGLRRIVKLDGVPLEMVGRLRQIVEQRELQVEVVAPRRTVADAPDPSASVTVLVAREASALAEGRDLETRLLAGGAGPAATDVTLRMGALLGYPRCCSDRFVRIAEQNDTTLAWALLPGVPHAPASPLTQCLHPTLALLSHSPCDLHCAPSIALGERLLRAIEDTERGFAARWRAVTARLQVVDHRGYRFALAADGRLETGATIVAADVVAPSCTDPHSTTVAQRLVGRTVHADSGGLVADDGSWHAPYVADHRGQP